MCKESKVKNRRDFGMRKTCVLDVDKEDTRFRWSIATGLAVSRDGRRTS